MIYFIFVLLFINLYLILLVFFTLNIGKQYYDDNKNLFYYLSNIFYKKISYHDIKFNNYFTLAYQNGLIEEKNNVFVLSTKGLDYYLRNNFIDNFRLKLLAIITLIFSFSNLVFQAMMLLSRQFE